MTVDPLAPALPRAAFALGGLLGAVIFLILWGVTPLNPTALGWMVNPYAGDFSFSAIAALAFQRESWDFPLGVINGLVYPAQTSVVFADSIPIFALLAKALAKVTGGTIHYFGLWGFVCTVLQGALAAAILFRHCRSVLLSVIGSLFLLFAPFFIGRMFTHVSMAGQWLILLPMFFIAYRDHPWVTRHEIILWTATAAASVGVLAYFLPMVMGLLVLYFWLRAEVLGRHAITRMAITLVMATIASLFTLWLAGGMLPGMTTGGAGYGEIPLNIAAFMNPAGITKFLPSFAIGASEQYSQESFQWVGAGVAVGLLIVVIQRAATGRLVPRYRLTRALPYVAVSVALIMFAATNTIRFGDSVIVSYPLPDIVLKAFSTFRSSARIGWVVWYLIVFAIIGALASLPAPRAMRAVLLVGLFVLQLWDAEAFKAAIRNTNAAPTAERLASPFWRDIGHAGKHLYILPFWGVAGPEERAQISREAVSHGVTTNVYWLGRYPMDAINATFNQKLAALQQGVLETDDILLFNHLPYLAHIKLPPTSQAYLVDDLLVIAKAGLEAPATGIQRVTVQTIELSKYLQHLSSLRDPSLIVIGGRDAPADARIDAETAAALTDLGLTRLADASGRFAYAAVVGDGKVLAEIMDNKPVSISADFAASPPVGAELAFSPGSGSTPSMKVGASNVLSAVFGLNIAVFDLEKRIVKERAAFGGYSREPGVVITIN